MQQSIESRHALQGSRGELKSERKEGQMAYRSDRRTHQTTLEEDKENPLAIYLDLDRSFQQTERSKVERYSTA